jgi:glucosamine-6-phosphate deaminase
MEIVILDSAEAVGAYAGASVAALIERTPDAVLGLATGSSPLGIYADLAARAAAGADFSRVRGFALDEYVGIPVEHPESYASVIRREVVEPLGLTPGNVRVPDGRADDLREACRDYEESIRASGGVDLQILGVGVNGHIGFNEPTSSFASRTRIKTLAPATREANARFFADADEVPTHCVTQGLGTIMEAREIVLVAQGESKAAAVAAIVEGPVSSMWPGSILQHHPHVAVVLDEAAAADLRLGDYYRHTFRHKPAWQRIGV